MSESNAKEAQEAARRPVVYTTQYQPMTREDKIAAGIVGSLFAGFVGIAIWLGVKDERRMQEEAKKLRLKQEAEEAEKKRKRDELEQWKENQRNAGMIVQRLYNGEWMAIPADTYKGAEFRKS